MLGTPCRIHGSGWAVGGTFERIVAVLGRRDTPSDAVGDYCSKLAEALRSRGVTLELEHVPWDSEGRLASIADLWRESAAWRGLWVLVQFTELMWSRRGFPFFLLAVVAVSKARGSKTAVVFHDAGVGARKQGFNRVRVPVQYRIMRVAYEWADRSFFTLPVDRVPWLPSQPEKAAFVPVGANVPSLDDLMRDGFRRAPRTSKRVAVFGITTLPRNMAEEAKAIAFAIRQASHRFADLRLLVVGRGAKEAEPHLRQALDGVPVEIQVRGLVPAEEVSRLLASSEVLLFVRGAISSRRGSGLAGIACGLPVVAYRGVETGFPITEAGVVLVPRDDLAALADALIQVLGDEGLRQSLRGKGLKVYRQWFSWDAIADRVLEGLNQGGAVP